MCRRFAIGHHEYDRFGVRVTTHMAQREQQCMLQVGGLDPLRLGFGELDRRQSASQSVEADDLQGILPKSGFDELVERQRRLLHRAQRPS
jgi:hypothetical protein